ncbi:hypothetical protein [Candidatus Venteria ishoeyi]|uniref:Uncharacterized protein n=1 Tax=Candidatus Venteria ishoeyi TaxID=1899563 RepID=A0A1H6FEU0_9GAMM|nr:hypothetical protein [Candidatus Venteria ishoeyi]MDM8545303.1 hypothetical protein [Candidatus Venteria ishoeyi]SEH07931.1 Uncharacterised protein [Candidatus Venteria ishoeyi]
MKPQSPSTDDKIPAIPEFKPLRLVAFVLFLLLGISLWLQWYTSAVSLPRYCQNTDESLRMLEKVITETRPAKDGDRKPYIIVAKLLFLVPRQQDEMIADYLARVRLHIEGHCR